MSSLDRAIPISISTIASSVTSAGFGLAGILSHKATIAPDRVRWYTEVDDMVTDGFATTDPEYLAAVVLSSQEPRPERWAILRADGAKPTLKYKISVGVVANSTRYAFRIGTATEVEFTSDASATNDEIITGLDAALTLAGVPAGFASAITGGAGSTVLEITASTAGNWTAIENLTHAVLKIETTHADPGIAAELALVVAEDADWHWLVTLFNSELYVKAAAAWAETAQKIYPADSIDTTIPTTVLSGATDLAADLKASAYKRTGVLYHHASDAFMSAGLAGRLGPLYPGSWTAAYKTLTGVPTYALTETQIGNIEDKNADYYTEFGGVGMTHTGRTAAGGGAGYFDVVLVRDWLSSELQAEIAALLQSLLKVPYTDPGAALLAGKVERVLLRASRAPYNALVESSIVVTTGLVADEATVDKNARTYRGISFRADYQGAIHRVPITGSIVIS